MSTGFLLFCISFPPFAVTYYFFLFRLKRSHPAVFAEIGEPREKHVSSLDSRHWRFELFLWSLRFTKLQDPMLSIAGVFLMAFEALFVASAIMIWWP